MNSLMSQLLFFMYNCRINVNLCSYFQPRDTQIKVLYEKEGNKKTCIDKNKIELTCHENSSKCPLYKRVTDNIKMSY